MEIAKNGTAFREIILGVLAYQYSWQTALKAEAVYSYEASEVYQIIQDNMSRDIIFDVIARSITCICFV
jgi:hypothetical protein